MNDLLRRALFLPPQASTVARDVDFLHYAVILTTMAGAFFVTLAGGILLFRYRRGRSKPPAPVAVLSLELICVALLLGIFLLFWFIGFRQYLRLRTPPADAIEIYVTAKKWMWSFSDTEGTGMLSILTVPAHRPVKLLMTSRDVIHSFYVPEFRIKQDVLPGRYTTAWFEASLPGKYEILCAEYCGTGHSVMRGEVVALSLTDYARWREGTLTPHPLASHGERVAAEEGCLRCHSIDGTPHIGPTWAGLYLSRIPLASGEEVLADEAYLTESMMDPQIKLHSGFAAIMPSYQGRLPPAKTAALLEYIKSLREPGHKR